MFWVAEDGNFNCHLFSGSHLSIHGSVFTSSGLEKCHVFKHLPTTVWRFKHTLVLHVISIFAPMQSVRKLRLTWNVNLFQISSSRRQKKGKVTQLLSWMNTWMSWNLLGTTPTRPTLTRPRPYDFPCAFSNASPPLQYTGDMDWWQLSVYVLYIQYVYITYVHVFIALNWLFEFYFRYTLCWCCANNRVDKVNIKYCFKTCQKRVLPIECLIFRDSSSTQWLTTATPSLWDQAFHNPGRCWNGGREAERQAFWIRVTPPFEKRPNIISEISWIYCTY